MNQPNPTTFPPYDTFRRNEISIDEFADLTELSYGITQQLLFRHPKEDLKHLVMPVPKREALSYSMADQEVESVELSCEWVSYGEYADRLQLDLDEVTRQAESGDLGPVQPHPRSAEKTIIWPPEKQQLPMDELPEPGKKKYQAKLAITAQAPLELDVDNLDRFEEVQQSFLKLAHSIGAPDEVLERAKEVLYRSCLLLRWTVFEVFLRSTVHELFRMHPSRLASDNRAKKPSISYEDIYSLSQSFSSMDALRESLVERHITQSESEGQSVHGLINFLKSAFKFSKDPYESWYVLAGTKHDTDYNSLLEIKEVRNCIVHDGGLDRGDLLTRFPAIPNRAGRISITEDYYWKSALVFRSIAHKIANSIVRGEYQGS